LDDDSTGFDRHKFTGVRLFPGITAACGDYPLSADHELYYELT